MEPISSDKKYVALSVRICFLSVCTIRMYRIFCPKVQPTLLNPNTWGLNWYRIRSKLRLGTIRSIITTKARLICKKWLLFLPLLESSKCVTWTQPFSLLFIIRRPQKVKFYSYTEYCSIAPKISKWKKGKVTVHIYAHVYYYKRGNLMYETKVSQP